MKVEVRVIGATDEVALRIRMNRGEAAEVLEGLQAALFRLGPTDCPTCKGTGFVTHRGGYPVDPNKRQIGVPYRICPTCRSGIFDPPAEESSP